MSLQMKYISVLGLVLAFVRHVNQIVETLAIRIGANQRLELILVQSNQLPDSLGESV